MNCCIYEIKLLSNVQEYHQDKKEFKFKNHKNEYEWRNHISRKKHLIINKFNKIC